MKLIMMALVMCLCCTFLCGQVTVDFTDPNTATYTLLPDTDPNYQPAQYNNGGVMMMWAGNGTREANSGTSERIVYIGPGSDIFSVANSVVNNPANSSNNLTLPYSAYDIADYNLDGQVIYIGPGSDIFVVANTIVNNPSNTSGNLTKALIEQIPSN